MSDAIPKAIYFSGLHNILGTMSCSQEGKKCITEFRLPFHTKMLSKVVANFLPVHNNTCQHWEQAVTCLFSLANFKSVESLNSSEHRWSRDTSREASTNRFQNSKDFKEMKEGPSSAWLSEGHPTFKCSRAIRWLNQNRGKQNQQLEDKPDFPFSRCSFHLLPTTCLVSCE